MIYHFTDELENWNYEFKTKLGGLILNESFKDLEDRSTLGEVFADSLDFGFTYPDFLRGESDTYKAIFMGEDINHEAIQYECELKFDGTNLELVPGTSRYFKFLSESFPLYDPGYGNSRNDPNKDGPRLADLMPTGVSV